MGAANARVPPVVERIVWNVVSPHVVPDILLAPANERIHFYNLPLIIPLDDARVRASYGLIATNGCDPGCGVAQRFAQRFELSQPAAEIRIGGPQIGPKLQLLLLGR